VLVDRQVEEELARQKLAEERRRREAVEQARLLQLANLETAAARKHAAAKENETADKADEWRRKHELT